MKKVFFFVVVTLGVCSQTFAQTPKQTLQLQATEAKRIVIEAPASLPDGTTKMTLPSSNAVGYLQNDGNGNLSWQTSVQASRAGLAQWYENNYGTGATFMDLNGTTPGGIPHMVSPFGGGLSGLSMVINPPGNLGTGTITATVWVDPVGAAPLAATTLSVSITGNNDFGFTDISATPIAFGPGDKIFILLDDLGTFAPNTDVIVTLFANF